MYAIKLKAPTKDYLWGGDKLKREYGKTSEKDIVAESWELSFHPDGMSVVENGEFAGMTLAEVSEKHDILGKKAKQYDMFPMLIKFINSRENLSIQVHPDDAYALKNENQYGKTEMWYVVEAETGSGIYYGLNSDVTRAEFEDAIKNNTVLSLLNFIPVKKGETYFIESGTIHAICRGLTIWELQQNSNITYRVYDYDRVGADGKKRDLHVEKAIAVSNLMKKDAKPVDVLPINKGDCCQTYLAGCDYFKAFHYDLKGKCERFAYDECFECITVLSGELQISGKEPLNAAKGDTVFIPAGYGRYTISGDGEFLIATL